MNHLTTCFYLLEMMLVTYEALCDRKNKPQGELNRLSTIVKQGANDIGADLKLVNPSTFPRVGKIAQYVGQEGYEAGIQRYFNENRYGIPERTP
jgi:hypothetical protein